MIPTNFLWWSILILANLSDIIIYYLLPYKFLDEKPPFLKGHFAGGIVYGLIFGTLAYYIGDYYLLQIIINIVLILMISRLHRKNSQIKYYKIMLFFTLSFLVLGITRLPIFIIFFPFGFTRYILFSIVIFLNIAIILWLCTKQFLTSLYKRVSLDIFLQILMFITAIAIFSLLLLLDSLHSFTYYALFVKLIGFAVATLYQLVPIIYFHTKELPHLLHDRNIRLMSHHARIYAESECEKAQIATDEIIGKARLNPKSDGYVLDDYGQNIGAFIDNICDYYQTSMKFTTHLHYVAPHTTVTFDEMLYMIGILMSSAIQSGNENYPAFITVNCLKDLLLIKQSNGTTTKMTDEKISKMIQAGSSTKEHCRRGFGLYNLTEDRLKRVDGHLEISTFYDKEYQNEYIEFVITVDSIPQKSDACDQTEKVLNA